MKRFISLFSGAGGLDLGLKKAGWHCDYACDIEPSAVETLAANANLLSSSKRGSLTHVEHADVREVTGSSVLARVGLRRGDVPLMAGGPPCQSWSSAGHQKGLDDPRGQLFRDFVRIADECDCRVILFENVRGLLTARGPDGEPGGALRVIRETMWAHGYRSALELINAADFGVPQRRVRLYIVAYRGTRAPEFPAPTHIRNPEEQPLLSANLLPWEPMKHYLLRVDELGEGELIRPSDKLGERLRGLAPGQGIKSTGKRESTRPGGHWGYMQGGFVADPELPARTVTASSQQDWILLDDGGYRRLTPRECAAIQSFPSDWGFAGSRSTQYRLIGNAVAPVMGTVLGKVVGDMLRKTTTHEQPFDPSLLPSHLYAHVRYTKREQTRNGESRRVAPTKRRVRQPGRRSDA